MNTRSLLAGLALAVATDRRGGVTAAAVRTQAPPPNPEAPAAKEARKAFVCANHMDRVADLLSRRGGLLQDRLSLAQDARAAAEEAGAAKLVTRIDRRIERITEAQAVVETRTGKFTAWVEENCAG